MLQNDSLTKPIVAGLALIAAVTVPAIFAYTRQLTKREPKTGVYEDKDGRASEESFKAYSAKWPKVFIIFFASIANGSAIATAVLATLYLDNDGILLDDWLTVATSFLILLQAIAIAINKNSVQSYNLGLYSFLSSIILAILLLAQGTLIFEQLLANHPAYLTLRIVEAAAVVGLAFASLCIPRRPEVYDSDGKPIDASRTVSALTRFTWGWPLPLLQLARKRNQLDLDDLPRPDHSTRAVELAAHWKRRNSKQSLWLGLLMAHTAAMARQWLLTLISSFLNFAPQWVILQLLRILETRTSRQHYAMDVWMWVIWLGVAVIVRSWIESHVFWISAVELGVPLRSQLSALIFEKSMKKKDVKGTGRSVNTNAVGTAPAVEGAAEPTIAAAAAVSDAPDRPDTSRKEEDTAEALLKSKQGTINLIGVDTKRVCDFLTFQFMFPASFFKLIVSLGFLVSLLGWKSLLAGFSTILAITPLNIFFSKRYAAAQDKLMKVRDDKLAVVNEALQGIRQIKFSALEPEWEKKINHVRGMELQNVWNVFKADTALNACWVTSPIALAAASLSVYAWLHGELLPSVAFVSLGVFRALEVTLSVIPELTTDALDAWTSIQRIEKYLQSPEIEDFASEAEEVAFVAANIAWPADEDLDDEDRFMLRDISVTFPKGELSIISGKTGSGKSLMLSAILGEVDILSGQIALPKPPKAEARIDKKANRNNWILPGSIAYVAQIPWIENASIRDNIEFGLPHDEERYHKTIEVCALRKDLQMLSDGENTEIGANGINLSGGQKWRVTLARAIYSRAGILVFDDIFSAVDSHVGRHIFEKCLTGELATGRTRILVTHHVGLCLPKTKFLLELGEGKVIRAGFLSELECDGTLALIKSQHGEVREDENATAVNSGEASDEELHAEDGADGNTLKKALSKQQEARKFVEDERQERGAIKTHVYSVYMQDAGGWTYWVGVVSTFVIVSALYLLQSWWVRIWTSQYEGEESIRANASKGYQYDYAFSLQHTFQLHHPAARVVDAQSGVDIGEHPLAFYMAVYVAIAVVAAAIGTLKFLLVYIGSIRASRLLFAKINFVVLRAPLRWLDTVPVGRILNRFTADFHILDLQLSNSFSFCFGLLMSLLAVVAASIFVSPYMLLMAIGFLILALYYSLRYLAGARPVKRLESNAKSPVFEQFGSALTGVATIRGFDKAELYIKRMNKKIDDYATATWHLWLFNRWLGWRNALVGSCYSVIISIIIILVPNIDPALAGFALGFSLEFSSSVIYTIRAYANLELDLNAAERIIEYTELPTESLTGAKPPAAWPTEGSIEVNDLVVSYAPELPPVLKGLTFSVKPNERIGVVGRTGAGKSSLTLAMFRFLEARSGHIRIDGLDISKINLHDLRSRLAIIPQDPTLFSGTVRSNLDPFDRYSDAELRGSLERVHLISGTAGTLTTHHLSSSPSSENANTNTNVFNDLNSPISEGGLNLSQGQRQLLCLARAIVARPRVMMLDEATSAVDMGTDALIQRSIREEFTDATLLVIAHRLSTIADFDRILVLSEGAVAEYGTPKELWERNGGRGIFRGMCEESGERERLKGIVLGL